MPLYILAASTGRSCKTPALPFCPYSAECVEGKCSESRLHDRAYPPFQGAETADYHAPKPGGRTLHVVALHKDASVCIERRAAEEIMPLEWGDGGPWGGIVLRPGSFPDPSVNRNRTGRPPLPLLPYRS